MKSRTLLLTTSLLLLPLMATAQEAPAAAPAAAPVQAAAAASALPAMTDNAQLDAAIRELQTAWAQIKYQEQNKDTQIKQMEKLAGKAAAVSAQYASYAEPKIWQAIILSTQAGLDGGMGSLGLVKEAKALLEQAIKLNPKALDGSAYTSLGSLYYKVPAWPIAFGDNGKARAYLEQSRAINPDGIDANYFYGDFLIEDGHAKEAIPVLEKALKAAPRPGREVADAGRRDEINEALAKARAKAAE